MQKCIADNWVILNLAGLRWVTKEDTKYVHSPQRYILKWNYKGSDSHHDYEDKAQRDFMYDQIRTALTTKEEGDGDSNRVPGAS